MHLGFLINIATCLNIKNKRHLNDKNDILMIENYTIHPSIHPSIHHSIFTDNFSRTVNKWVLGFLLFATSISNMTAEGIKQLAPANTDVTMLYTCASIYGTFAGYNALADSRLHIHISDPTTEKVHFGFSQQTSTANADDGTLITTAYYFRVKDPNGNIVFGPQKVDNTTANANTWALANAGPVPVVGASGYTPFTYTPAVGAPVGDYYVEFSDSPTATATAGFIAIKYWDITVASGATAHDGRIWSKKWAFRTPSISHGSDATYTYFDRPFNGHIYTYADDGFVNKVDFLNSGFRGLSFNLAFNQYGVANTGNITSDRKSVSGVNSTLAQYKLFLNNPDIAVYPTGTVGAIGQIPFVVNCTGSSTKCISYSTTQSGLVQVLLDFDTASGAGKYDTGTADVLLYQTVTPGGSESAPYKRCLTWDGKNGLGVTVATNVVVPIYLTYIQGLVHFPVYDVEFNPTGFNISSIRPTPSPSHILKFRYDDTNISGLSGPGEPKSNVVAGVAPPAHKWTVQAFGDLNTINTWWFGNQIDTSSALVPVTPACSITGATTVCTTSTGHSYAGPVGYDSYTWSISGNGTITSATNAQNVTVSAGAAGSFTLTLVTVVSSCSLTCNQVVSVNSSVCNAPPVANLNSVSTLEDTPIGIDVLANDTDPDTNIDPTSVTITEQPRHGTTSINPTTGEITYTPDPNFNGLDTLIYQVCDLGTPALCDTAIVFITINPVNDPPIANFNTGTTPEDTPLSIDVLANDTDSDGNIDPTSVTITEQPKHGTTSVNPTTGAITYTPDLNFNGLDTLIYRICDDGTPLPAQCDTAIVYLNVTPVNDPPIATFDIGIATEDTPLSIDVLANDSDPDSNIDPTSVTITEAPKHGTTSINPTTGLIIYTPDPNFNGLDTLVYQVCDTGFPVLCDTAIVYLTINPVNDPPVATADINNTLMNTPVSGQVLTNDKDPEGTVLVVNPTPVSNPTNGLVVLNLNGTYTYTPNPNFVGTDIFTYQVCDSGSPAKCDTASVTIEVMPPPTFDNDDPIANNDATQTPINTPVLIVVKANDFDPDGDPLSNPTPVTTPVNGLVIYNPDGTVTYTPNLNFVGIDTFKYAVCDNQLPSKCDTATVIVEVLPNLGLPNNPPIAIDDAKTTLKNTSVSGSVATNDHDPENDALTYTKLTNPQNGSVVFNTDGTFTYTPALDFVGTDHFIYNVCDATGCDTATVYITIQQPPVGTISGTVFQDYNANGSLDSGEPSIGKTTYVKLVPKTGSNCGTVAIDVAVADANTGNYQFNNVLGGDYCLILDDNNNLNDVTPTAPPSWSPTSPTTLSAMMSTGVVANQNFGLLFICPPKIGLDVKVLKQ